MKETSSESDTMFVLSLLPAMQHLSPLHNRDTSTKTETYDLLTVHLSIILAINQLNAQNLIMFRALLCSSSGGQNSIIQHLVSSHL